MSPRRAAILAVVSAVLALAACSTNSAAAPLPRAFGSPPASVGPSPAPSASASAPATKTPTPTPTPSKKPTPSKSTPHPKPLYTPPASKIPVWPTAVRWRGPLNTEGSTGTSAVALTFDDGPGPYTSQFLDVLDKYRVKATFCLIGRQIHAYEAVVRRMINDGMTICNHSWDHNEQLGKLSGPTIWNNLAKMNAAVHQISPTTDVSYFRHPGGNFTIPAISVCEQLGMRPLYWTVDTEDWTKPGVDKIEASLAHSVGRGSIVLMHDGGGDRSESLAALKAMMPTLKSKYHLIALPTAQTVTVHPPARPGPGPARPPAPPIIAVPDSTPPPSRG